MLYIYAGGAVIFILVFLYAKIKSYLADKYKAEKEAALVTAVSEGKIIMNENFRNESIVKLKAEQQEHQVQGQAKIDAGDREVMNNDHF